MHDDTGRPLRLSRLVDCVGHLVEADHLPDGGSRIQPTVGHGVKGSVPVLRMRAAAELDGDALVGGVGARDRVAAVLSACRVDAGHEFA